MPPDRGAQCRAWNASRDHQVQAGKARASAFTSASQAQAAYAQFRALSVRLRAAHCGAQFFPSDAAKYITPDDIGSYVGPLPLPLRRIIYACWCAGFPYDLTYWLGPSSDTRIPAGSLFAPDTDHPWQVSDLGWFRCATCFAAAICPLCFPAWPDDPVLARLPQVVCATHGGAERG